MIWREPATRTLSPPPVARGELLYIFVWLAAIQARKPRPTQSPAIVTLRMPPLLCAVAPLSRSRSLPVTPAHSLLPLIESCRILSLHLNPPFHFLISCASLRAPWPMLLSMSLPRNRLTRFPTHLRFDSGSKPVYICCLLLRWNAFFVCLPYNFCTSLVCGSRSRDRRHESSLIQTRAASGHEHKRSASCPSWSPVWGL